MKRDCLNVDMYKFSLVLLIHAFVKMHITTGELSGVLSGFVLFAKATLCFVFFFFRKLNFEFSPRSYECHVLMKEYIKYIHKRRGTL